MGGVDAWDIHHLGDTLSVVLHGNGYDPEIDYDSGHAEVSKATLCKQY